MRNDKSTNATEAADVHSTATATAKKGNCKMWKRVINKWDWLVYRLAFKSFKRMAKTEPHWMYFLSLWLAEWMKENPIGEHLKSSARTFFESLRN